MEKQLKAAMNAELEELSTIEEPQSNEILDFNEVINNEEGQINDDEFDTVQQPQVDESGYFDETINKEEGQITEELLAEEEQPLDMDIPEENAGENENNTV